MENMNTSKLMLNNEITDQQNINNHSHSSKMIISKKYFKQPTINSYLRLRSLTHHKTMQRLQIKKKYWLVKKLEKNHIWLKLKKSKKILYLILEEPSSSPIGQFIFIIIISIIAFTTFNAISQSRNVDEYEYKNVNSFRSIANNLSSIIFLLEYLLRLWCCTAFDETLIDNIKKPIMIIDFIAIIPFIIQECSIAFDFNSVNMIRILILIKTLAILKLIRYLKGSEIFWEGIKSSLASFGFLLLNLIIANIIFAICYYFVEHNMLEIEAGNTCVVTSIPDAMWWALTTMTTVGYGDKYPLTTTGKFISGLTALTGMLMIALPVAILGINFQRVYDIKLENSRIKRLKKAILKNDSSLTEDQKEILFMNQRMKALSYGSNSIKELLIKSDELYHKVESEIKTLYTALYAEQKQIESMKITDSGLFGMSGKIKIMERLKRAKKKIKLMQLVRKRTLGNDHNTNNSCTTRRNNPRTTIRKSQNSPQKLPLEKIDEGLSKILSLDKIIEPIIENKLPISTCIREGSNDNEAIIKPKNYTHKTWIDPKKLEYLDDIPSSDNSNILPIACMKNHNYDQQEKITDLDEEIRHPRSKDKVESRIFIKSNSQDDENSFIKYKNENLDFLSNHRLNDLMVCDSDSDSDNIQDIHEIGSIAKMDHNLHTFDLISDPNHFYNLTLANKIPNNPNADDKITATTTRREFLNNLPKLKNINLQSKTFKLAEKIFEDEFLNIYVKCEENQVCPSGNYSPDKNLKANELMNYLSQTNRLSDSNPDNELNTRSSLIKNLCYIDGPKANKIYATLNSCKILEENEDLLLDSDDLDIKQPTISYRIDYKKKGNRAKEKDNPDNSQNSSPNISNQSSPRVTIPLECKFQNRSNVFRKKELIKDNKNFI